MTRAAAVSVEQNFSGGLITEATGLNFPENSASDMSDVDLRNDGALTRRKGFAPEVGYQENSLSGTPTAIMEYVWNNVANIGDLTFVVQQIDNTLKFFQVTPSALSTGLSSSSISLSSFKAAGAPTTDSSVCQFTQGNGRLFVAHPYCDPFYVDYDLTTDTFSATRITIQIRDFTRQSDGLKTDERPATLTNLHKYNLYNQGWYWNNADALTKWENARSDEPSNADVWWVYKNANEDFDTGNIDKIYRGNSAAPNGHYILDAFDQDRITASGIGGIDPTTAGAARPSCVAFYSGRVWYGGVASSSYGDKIYFSQIIESDDQIGKCYQALDPTSEDDSDLLPSDGGVIVIPDLGILKKIVTIGPSLMLFSTNGLWVVQGSTGAGFSANDYSIMQVSDKPASGSLSFVIADGAVFWWNFDGIYVAAPSQAGQYEVKSISNPTIKTYYKTIPPTNINFAKGVYDSLNQVILWVFRLASVEEEADNYRYDHVLNLRTTTGAFFPWTINSITSGPSVSGILITKGFESSYSDETVMVGTDHVYVTP